MPIFDRIITPEREHAYDYGDPNEIRNWAYITEISYDGELEKIISELSRALRGERFPDANAFKILHPPRIVRAVIDYKIELESAGHDTSKIEELVRNAIKIGLTVYSLDDFAAYSMLESLSKEIKIAFPDLLKRIIYQAHEFDTCCAMDPLVTEACAEQMYKALSKNDVLFISIGHGSIASGFDTYLRYCEMCRLSGSEFYVVRFSKRHDDRLPRLTTSERLYLVQASLGRDIVIFDDVKGGGSKLRVSERYFTDNVFPGRKINVFFSYEAQDPLRTDGD